MNQNPQELIKLKSLKRDLLRARAALEALSDSDEEKEDIFSKKEDLSKAYRHFSLPILFFSVDDLRYLSRKDGVHDLISDMKVSLNGVIS